MRCKGSRQTETMSIERERKKILIYYSLTLLHKSQSSTKENQSIILATSLETMSYETMCYSQVRD